MEPQPDDRITIRLTPTEAARFHRILQQLVSRRSYAQFLDLKHADVEAARDLLQRIPNIVTNQVTG